MKPKPLSQYQKDKDEAHAKWAAQYVLVNLVNHEFNVVRTAIALGIDRSNLLRLIKIHKLRENNPQLCENMDIHNKRKAALARYGY